MSGEPNSSTRPFGFEEDRVTIREEEAAIIRDFASRALAGEALVSLADELNTRGIQSAQGNPWKNTTLKKMLSRPINCGRITYKSDPDTGAPLVVGRLPGEPILSEEVFDQLCSLFAARHLGRPTRYLCASLAVCGACGFPLHGRARKDLRPYPDESVRRHYWCNATVGGCGQTSIDQRALDKAVEALVVEILSDRRNTAAIAAAAEEFASETARLDLAIAEAEDVATALSDRLGRGELTLSRYDVAIRPLDQRIAKLKAEREAFASPGSGPVAKVPVEATREQWRRRWDAADDKEKRELLKMGLHGRHLVIAPMPRGAGGISQMEVTRRIKIR
jgi:site-specific DNA recombinase